MGFIHKVGKLYQKAMMKNMGIFIFAGLMMVIFGENGWFPNGNLNEIANIVYIIVLPIMVAYECGAKAGNGDGGIAAVIAMTGILARDENVGFLGAMIIGPLAGFIWKMTEQILQKKADFRMKMLTRNLTMAVLGFVLALISYFLFVPLFESIMETIRNGIEALVENQLIFALSVFVEPAKVFFLNNLVNHAILIPLGMEQLRNAGSSVLFLVEANPGPGLGMLLAFLLLKYHEKSGVASTLVAHAVGGIHEVYFPFVISELKLLIPLILGGMAGNAYFSMMDAGLQGPVSPGSILIVLLMAGKGKVFSVLIGVVLSALVSCVGTIIMLGTSKETENDMENTGIEEVEPVQVEIKKERIDRIAVVCDGGIGSSAMGAALLRRNLAAKQIKDVTVEAFAADMVPVEVKVILCQKDYYVRLSDYLKTLEVFTVDNLVQRDGYTAIIEEIEKRNS